MSASSTSAELSAQEPTSVAVLAAVRLYREGLIRLLEQFDEFDICLAGAPVLPTVSQMRRASPRLVIVEITAETSAALVQQIIAACPSAHVVAFAVREVPEDILACAAAGFSGFVTEEGDLDDLVGILRGIIVGDLPCTPRSSAILYREVTRLAQRRSRVTQVDSLTLRQREVYKLVCKGASNKEIARTLQISIQTVKTHVHQILNKINVQSRIELAARHASLPVDLVDLAGR